MKLFIRFFLYNFCAVVVTFITLNFLEQQYKLPLFFEVKKICGFHLALSVAVLTILYTIYILKKEMVAYAFLATALIRMVTVFIFIFPMIKNTTETPIYDALFLIIPYFLFISLEATFTIKLINKKM